MNRIKASPKGDADSQPQIANIDFPRTSVNRTLVGQLYEFGRFLDPQAGEGVGGRVVAMSTVQAASVRHAGRVRHGRSCVGLAAAERLAVVWTTSVALGFRLGSYASQGCVSERALLNNNLYYNTCGKMNPELEEARKAMIAKRFGGNASGANTGGAVRRKHKAAPKSGGGNWPFYTIISSERISSLIFLPL